MKKQLLSVCIIALNEEKNIARALESVSWADEILVIDGGSEDRTLEILRDEKAPWARVLRILEAPWKGFRIQRMLCLKEAKNDWIFMLDSDEACSSDLRIKVESILSEENPHSTWKVHRQEYFLGKEIRHGIWNPSYQDRFFNRAGIEYVNDIHEYPKYPVAPKRIHEVIFHSPSFHPEHFLQKMNKYTSIEARDRVNAGMRTNLFRVLLSGPAMFLKNYFYYSAYKDGSHGLVISVLEGVSRSVRHVKMWQYQNEKKQTLP